MSVINLYKQKVALHELCSWTGMPRSNYYYQPTCGQKGIRPSTFTMKRDGEIVDNAIVVDDIRKILSGEFVCYGYQNVTAELREMSYIINPKKVYRLMDENHLLLGKVIRTQGKREWVKFRKIEATKPLEYLCWDIKYVWVSGEHKNYFLLSLMDVYTRRILDWIFQSSIRKIDVIKMINRIDIAHGLKGVVVRNDNGSQFIANKVRHYLRTLEAHQEFTHIATPEENSYIEAFHSIFEREVVQRHVFASFYEAKLTIMAYMNFYNDRRRHGSLKRVSPMKKWNEYYLSSSSDKPQTAKVSEEMSRVSALQDTRPALDFFGDTANFADRMMNENNEEVLNCFKKNVQLIGG
jgi:putative transposase